MADDVRVSWDLTPMRAVAAAASGRPETGAIGSSSVYVARDIIPFYRRDINEP
jgi:hypothetical protein